MRATVGFVSGKEAAMRGTDWLSGRLSLMATWALMRFFGRYSRRVGGFFAARLWFTPWKPALSEQARTREELWVADTEPIAFPFGRGQIRGFGSGRGPTILLVHGWGERAAAMGGFIAPLTHRGYRVVAIDLPGHGASTAGETNPLIVADALREVADQLEGVHGVIAHSMGGLALGIAMEKGLRVERAAFLAPAVRAEHVLDKFTFLFRLPPRAALGLRNHLDRRFGTDIWRQLSLDRMAASFDIPALIIHDQDDPQMDLADSEVLAASWRGSRLMKTKGLGHARLVRDQDVVASVVGFFGGPRLATKPERVKEVGR